MKTWQFVWPLALLTVAAQAQEIPKGAFALVNAQPVSEQLLQVNVDANVARGQADTQQLRARLKSELIGQEILAQEALQLKLDQIPQAQAAWQQLRQNFLAQLLLENFNRNHPVTEAQLKAEYEAFLQAMQGEKEYKLSIITVPSKARAEEIMTQLNNSKDSGLFAKLAMAESSDESKINGGALNWLVSTQIIPAVSNVVANLPKGKMSNVPIQTNNGWNIVRVDDIRDYTPPSMKELEPRLRQAAMQKALAAYVQSLRQKATVVE